MYANYYRSENCNLKSITNEYKSIETPDDLYFVLLNVWSEKTCTPRLREKWNEENVTLGQCSITAFLAQDIFGGRVFGIPRPDGNFHCYNVVGNSVYDLTSEQFGDEILDYSNSIEQFREIHFSDENKKERYDILCYNLKEYLNLEYENYDPNYYKIGFFVFWGIIIGTYYLFNYSGRVKNPFDYHTDIPLPAPAYISYPIVFNIEIESDDEEDDDEKESEISG